jgi:amidohydrolase
MHTLKDQIKECAVKIKDSVITDRRHLHANPELSFQEYETAAYIKRRLDELDIGWESMANTGVVALVQGQKPSGKVVALRADMDALPITEANTIDYRSGKQGIMHACGHDAHTASLLGVAAILQSMRHAFGGTVKLIFQPAEEKLPGGANQMIQEGVLKNPQPQSVIGQHVMPSLPAGKIALRKGKHMASMDELFVTVRGKGGHGAQPHQNTDPVLITSHIIIALQQIVSRMSDPHMPSVLSFGKQIANGAINVIPDEVYMEGTFRTMDEKWRKDAHVRMKKLAESIAVSMGGSCEFNIVKGYPFLVNEEQLTGRVQQYAEDYLGKENVLEAEIWMAAEDFAYYTHATQACFYLLGVGNKEKGIHASLHTSTFNIDEEALVTSTGLMTYIALKELETH